MVGSGWGWFVCVVVFVVCIMCVVLVDGWGRCLLV